MIEDECIDRLPGTTGREPGGLVIKKKSSDAKDDGFKKPSIFGLDKLAKAKREENARQRRDDGDDTPGITDSTRRNISK